jgi:putative membrane-bound dehydrogenase-like protein
MHANRKSLIPAAVLVVALAWLVGRGASAPLLGSPETRGEERSWALPDGFTFEMVAGPPQVRYPMFATFDDRGRLFVAESSGGSIYGELQQQSRRCRIVLLEDTNGDGIFDRAQTFADSLAFPMGLTWHQGRLYVADPPHVLSLEDTNGDGQADRREVILSGFGAVTNGSLHGITVGPDGWLYMTVGWPDSYRLQRADGSWLEGVSGGVLRSRLDGTDPEVVALGFENPMELVWTETGELLTTLNWYMRPEGGLRDALVHVVEGGVYPYHAWRERAQPLPTTGPWLPAVVLRPPVAHSGMMRYEGSAFPERHRGLFVAEYNTRQVVRYALERDGSSYGASVETFLAHDHPAFLPSDVVEADDGSLIVVDTGVWYNHCPLVPIDAGIEGGGIWRIRYAPVGQRGARSEPLPAFRKLSTDELVRLLGDPARAVRRGAKAEIESRGADAVAPLARLITSGSSPEAALRAIWVLGRIEDPSALEPLRSSLAAANPSLASAAARALGARWDSESVPRLAALLAHDLPPVRLAAAEALSRIGSSGGEQGLIQALAAPDMDRILEHTLAYAVYRSADATTLRAALEHEHPRVQTAGLYLLNEPRFDALVPTDVTARAAAADPGLRLAAREVLRSRPEWAHHAAALMRNWARPGAPAAEHERVAEYARALSQHPPIAELTAELVSEVGQQTSVELRRLLIEGMAHHEADVPGEWARALGAVIRRDAELRGAALDAVTTLGLETLDDALIAMLEDPAHDPAVRTRILDILSARHPAQVDRHVGFLLDRLEAEPGPGRIRAASLLAGATLRLADLERLARISSEAAAIDPELILDAAERSPDPPPGILLEYLGARLGSGWRPEAERVKALLERAGAAERSQTDLVLTELARAEERHAALWGRYQPLLSGGDPQRGRGVFFGPAGCTACHQVAGAGGSGGPDLTRIGLVRPGESILRSILFPHSTPAPQGFEAWVFETRDGRSLVGMLEREGADDVELRDITGRVTRLSASDVVASRPLGRSLMPEGLLGPLTDEQARDLLAYLQSLR